MITYSQSRRLYCSLSLQFFSFRRSFCLRRMHNLVMSASIFVLFISYWQKENWSLNKNIKLAVWNLLYFLFQALPKMLFYLDFLSHSVAFLESREKFRNLRTSFNFDVASIFIRGCLCFLACCCFLLRHFCVLPNEKMNRRIALTIWDIFQSE